MTTGTIKKQIEDKLRLTFEPKLLVVMDESHHHIGHAGARPEGETHFYVKISSSRFKDLSRIECHKLVYACLDQELKTNVHALRLETSP